MSQCPCGSKELYADCCDIYISGTKNPETAEKLMRSRYTAYVNVEIDYLFETLHPDNRGDHDSKNAKDWAQSSEWIDLEIVNTKDGGPEDSEGVVEFCANYRQKGSRLKHHEIATFKKLDDKWYFEDGEAVKPDQVKRDGKKIGRNEPCPCGSGKKYKKCCA